MTLFYSTPLIFTGLAVAVPFQAGLFNIGAEGQLTLGALAAAAVGAVCRGCRGRWRQRWRFWRRSQRGRCGVRSPVGSAPSGGAHEVINTIMLNFVAAGLASYVTLYLLKNPDTQNPETRPIGAGYLISQFGVFGGAPVSMALPLAIVAAGLVWILFVADGRRIRDARGGPERIRRAGGGN